MAQSKMLTEAVLATCVIIASIVSTEGSLLPDVLALLEAEEGARCVVLIDGVGLST